MSHAKDQEAAMEELIERARAGDQRALDEIFRRSRSRLDAWAKQRIKGVRAGSASPSDIAQNAAKRAFQKFSTFEGREEANFNVWLRTILINCIAQAHRDAHRMKRDESATSSLDDPDDVPAREKSQSQAVSHQEEQRRLIAHLSQLPPDQGEAIYLYHLHERSVAEVALDMNRTEAAIGGLLQRGHKALRRSMNSDPTRSAEEAPEDLELLHEAETAFLSYLRRRDAGEKVDRGAFLAQHPRCASELRSMLDWMERIQLIWATGPDSQ
jgi:RNA polymerase sigma-70 factor (ECF subfamily)